MLCVVDFINSNNGLSLEPSVAVGLFHPVLTGIRFCSYNLYGNVDVINLKRLG